MRTGPCQIFEEARYEVGKFERALRLAVGLSEACLSSIDALDPFGGKRRVRRGYGAEKGAEGPLGALEGASAQRAHVSLERGGFLVGGAGVQAIRKASEAEEGRRAVKESG